MKKQLYMDKKFTRYVTPEAFEVPVDGVAVLCDSPDPGGREDLTYEDWQQYDNDYATP
jgi:hypothetical protein